MHPKIQSNKETMGQSRRRIVRLRLDFRTRTPIYAQIGRQVTALVVRGELQPGDQLPTVRQLAADLDVNFNTVARAYRRLDEAGVISTQHGRGTFVVGLPKGSRRSRRRNLEGLAGEFLDQAAQAGFGPEAALEAVARLAEKNPGR